MGKVHGKDAQLLISDADLSNWFNQFEVQLSRDIAESTGFRPSGDLKTYVAGLKDGTMSASGIFDGDKTVIDDRLEALLNQDDGGILTATPSGFVVGQRAWLINSFVTTYNISTPLDGVVAMSLEAQSEGDKIFGLALTDDDGLDGGFAADANEASVDNGVTAGATALGLSAHVHVTANDRDAATNVIVQHSTDDAVWVDLATEAVPAATVGGYHLTTTGTVNRYVRLLIEASGTSGTLTAFAAFARR